MAYIGNQPTDNFVTFATQNFSTSATSSYTLSHAVSNENEIALFINNVRQHPGSGKAYTASGTALTLSANTASTDVMYCIFLGRAIQSTVPATNSINNAMVSSSAAIATTKLGAGAILQVVSTNKSDSFTTTSTSFTDITGLSVAITPSSSSNKILVSYDITGSEDVDANRFYLRLLRGTTVIGGGDSAGSRFSGIGGFGTHNNTIQSGNVSGTFLDSPSTTSATTYKIQGSCTAGGNTGFINRTEADGNEASQIRSASNITVYEVKV